MRLAVRIEEGRIPGGGYHYMLHPMEVSDAEAPLWAGMGYVLTEVDEARGRRLLQEAGAAIRHQVEIAVLVDPQGKGGPAR